MSIGRTEKLIANALNDAIRGATVLFVTDTPIATMARALAQAKGLVATPTANTETRDICIGQGIIMFRRADEPSIARSLKALENEP